MSDSKGRGIFSLRSSGSEVDPDQTESVYSRYMLPLEKIRELLRAIYATGQILEEEIPCSVRDRLYRGLGKPPKQCFLVPQSVKNLILHECRDPEASWCFLGPLSVRSPMSSIAGTGGMVPEPVGVQLNCRLLAVPGCALLRIPQNVKSRRFFSLHTGLTHS